MKGNQPSQTSQVVKNKVDLLHQGSPLQNNNAVLFDIITISSFSMPILYANTL